MCSSAVNYICMFPLSHQSCLVNFWMPLCGAYSLGVVATGCLEMWETDVRWGGVCWPSIFFGETHLKSRHGFIEEFTHVQKNFVWGNSSWNRPITVDLTCRKRAPLRRRPSQTPDCWQHLGTLLELEAGEFDNVCAFYWSFVEKTHLDGTGSQVGAEFLGFWEAMKCCQMLQAHDRSHAACSFSTWSMCMQQRSSPLKRLTSAKTDIHKLGCSSFASLHPGCLRRHREMVSCCHHPNQAWRHLAFVILVVPPARIFGQLRPPWTSPSVMKTGERKTTTWEVVPWNLRPGKGWDFLVCQCLGE